MATLAELQTYIGEWAKRKGWWGIELINIPEKICLMHSELSEALEEYRNGISPKQIYTDPSDTRNKPEGISIELADTVIRILHFCAEFDIDLEAAITQKMAYNEGRPYRHGDKLA